MAQCNSAVSPAQVDAILAEIRLTRPGRLLRLPVLRSPAASRSRRAHRRLLQPSGRRVRMPLSAPPRRAAGSAGPATAHRTSSAGLRLRPDGAARAWP